MKKTRMQTGWRHTVATGSALLMLLYAGPAMALEAAGKAAPDSAIAVISASANHAQQRCNELGHDNADEYVSCTDALFKAVKGKTVKATQERLGVLYFGWVGAEHWARVGLPGSEEAAKKYFLQYQPLQQQLHLSDEALCAALAGDCKVRLAQAANAKRDYLPGGKPAAKGKN